MQVGVRLARVVHDVRDPKIAHLLEHHLTASHEAAAKESVKVAAQQIHTLHLVIFLQDLVGDYFQRPMNNDLFAHHLEVLVQKNEYVVDVLQKQGALQHAVDLCFVSALRLARILETLPQFSLDGLQRLLDHGFAGHVVLLSLLWRVSHTHLVRYVAQYEHLQPQRQTQVLIARLLLYLLLLERVLQQAAQVQFERRQRER